MSKSRKILQVLLQILLLPVYCFLEVFGWSVWVIVLRLYMSVFLKSDYFIFYLLGIPVLILIWWTGAFVLGYLLFKIKNIKFVYEFRKTGKKIPIIEKERNKISLGRVGSYYERPYEGYYETEKVVGYKDEEEQTPETRQTQAMYLTFFTFAIPIGIIKLILAIIACFTNKFYIIIIKPKNKKYTIKNYGYFFFGYIKTHYSKY